MNHLLRRGSGRPLGLKWRSSIWFATLGEHILHLRRLELLKTSQYLVVGFGKKSLGLHILALRLSMAVTRYHDRLDGLFHHYTSYTISIGKAGS